MDLPLFFRGRRHRAARVIETRDQPPRRVTSHISRPAPPIFVIRVQSAGQRWQAVRPCAAWFDFAGLNPANSDEVLRFVGKWGDPYGWQNSAASEQAVLPFVRNPQLRQDILADQRRPLTTTTAGWANLKGVLWLVAAAWTPESPQGLSRPSTDEAQRTDAAYAIAPYVEDIGRDLIVRPHPQGGARFVLEAGSLATFMLASAIDALARRPLFAKCKKCGGWFERQRKDNAFCSAACRAQFATAQKAALQKED